MYYDYFTPPISIVLKFVHKTFIIVLLTAKRWYIYGISIVGRTSQIYGFVITYYLFTIHF